MLNAYIMFGCKLAYHRLKQVEIHTLPDQVSELPDN
jgi:hypothetical protein